MEPLVVYIIGDNRSGTTLLDYLLSCHPDAVSVGELHQLNGYFQKKGVGINYDWKCSCGSYVDECIFWHDILKEVSFLKATKTRLEIKENSKSSFIKRWSYKKNLNELLLKGDTTERGKEIATNCWNIYKAVANKTGKTIIIDSSKDAFEAYFLNKYRRGNIRFLLLERDIAAVAYSKKKRVNRLPKEMKSYLGVRERTIYEYILASYKVLLKNRIIASILQQGLDHTIVDTVKYTELAKNTAREITSICNFLDVMVYTPPAVTNQNTEAQHALCGSPSRYDSKPIKPDGRWKHYYNTKPIAFVFSKILQFFS